MADTKSDQLLTELVSLCERVLLDPRTAIEVREGVDQYYAENVDGSEVTNSTTWDGTDGVTDGNRSQSFQRHAVPGGVMLDCSVWHAYWKGEHPYTDLLDVLDARMPQLLGGTVTRSGGQLKDMVLRAETYVWTDGAFPPRTWLEASISNDSINLYFHKAVADAE